MFPGRFGGPMDSSNYRHRVLHRLAKELGLPKLNFQVIRRTIATLGKTKGHPKGIQGMMRHTRMATTMEVYMQSLEPEVRKAINSIHDELMATGTEGSTPKKPSASRRSRQREAEVAAPNANATTAKEHVSAPEEEMVRTGKPPRGKLLLFAGKIRASDWGCASKYLKRNGGPDRDRTDDLFHAMEHVKSQMADGKALMSRHNRQNRPNGRYLRAKCGQTTASGRLG